MAAKEKKNGCNQSRIEETTLLDRFVEDDLMPLLVRL